MKLTIEFYVTIMLIVVMSVLGANLIMMNIQIANVRAYSTQCIKAIEASGHDQKLLDTIVDNSPYPIEITRVAAANQQELIRIEISYEYVIPLLAISNDYQISGVAR